jgi:hypothetical protein
VLTLADRYSGVEMKASTEALSLPKFLHFSRRPQMSRISFL